MATQVTAQADLAIEYAVEDATLTDGMKAKVSRRLQKLAAGHKDLHGAAVAISNVKGTKRGATYRCRIVLYIRPANIVAIHKAGTERTALLEALAAAERQVREHRERMWQRSRAHRAVTREAGG